MTDVLIWLSVNWHYIAFPLAVILLFLWSVLLKQKRSKPVKEEEQDLPPEPPKGVTFFDVDLMNSTGFKGQRKKTEQEMRELSDRSKRLAQEAKAAAEDYQKKRVYYEQMGNELKVRYTLLQKQLDYIDSIIRNQEELEGITKR